ncbi:Bacteriochlorophyll synthase 33 kDa chain [Rhodovastum atsumiense]|uniref:Chlorophyll synthase ChlG n=1 Tax=Rhodovastum atsumiense TaxID=504468 RepID=A0A5M6IXC2_9PROT|nr:chlorophyll synthase ChlG [Rhodovastum atsumiense]KAA5612911.1 chlorophyll synthase ChlG [Rhodovastum atsumiense]CAH2601006.1 Bacteriochlorophyll synthase 33 kDa chain [Rhodovastum atsumiense]
MSEQTVTARPAMPAALEVLHPITWFAPMWAFGCGVVSSGLSTSGKWPEIIAGVVLAGPLMTATSQVVNDWYDRHVDAINEPNRPIPSGRIPGNWGFYMALGWSAVSLALAAWIGTFVLIAASLGMVLAWIYSAPPLRLKQNGWWGNAAVGGCYEGLPWITGAAVMAGGVPDWRVFLLAFLYSAGAHGIMTLNDFKSVEGDRKMGLASLPVQLGVERAAKLACVVMAVPQAVVIALLLGWDRPVHAAVVGLLVLAQGFLMARWLQQPRERAPWYNATGTTLYVIGMQISAWAVGPLVAAAS